MGGAAAVRWSAGAVWLPRLVQWPWSGPGVGRCLVVAWVVLPLRGRCGVVLAPGEVLLLPSQVPVSGPGGCCGGGGHRRGSVLV